jgi:hypothetical protein
VLPTGRYFGRKTQKWPYKNLCGRKNQRPNFLQICLEMAEMWPNFFELCSSGKNLDNLQKLTRQSTGTDILNLLATNLQQKCLKKSL